MKHFTLKRMVLCAMALLFAGGASAATETYTFKGIATDGTGNFVTTAQTYGEDVTITGSANTKGFCRLYSYDGSLTFNNRFAAGKNSSADWTFRYRKNNEWSGLATQKNGVYLAILNLKNGDKVTINMKSEQAALTFDGVPATTVSIATGTAVGNGTKYEISTAESSVSLNLVTTGETYIYSIIIETADIPNNGTSAATNRVYGGTLKGGDAYNNGCVTLTLGGTESDTWDRGNTSSTPTLWGDYFANWAKANAGNPLNSSDQRCNTAGNIPTKGSFIKVSTTQDGIIAIYGKFRYKVYISDEKGYLFECLHESDLTEGWHIVNIPLKANVTYWVWNDAYPMNFCGYKFYPNGVTIADGLAYTTFGNYTTSNYAVPSGVKAYAATYTSGASTVTLKEVTAINAGQGVLLEGSAATYDLTVADADATNYEGNLLQATATDVALQSDGSYTYYVYGRGTKGEGFYKVSSSKTLTIAAGKAYLKVPVSASAPSFLDFDFEDNNTTGINKVQDSGLKVQGSDTYYNLAGQRVAQPTKGLYIVNGKKVIIK